MTAASSVLTTRRCMLVRVLLVIRRGSLTIDRSLSHLLALTAFLLGNRGGFLVVFAVHRRCLALFPSALLGSRGRGGADLAAGVLDLLEDVVSRSLHAADGCALEFGGSFVPVNLWLLA
jgi:hypothetical protein